MQESKFPPPLSEFVQNMEGPDFFYLPPVKQGNPPSPPIGGIDIGYGLTKNGAKNPAAWTFLAELTNGVGLQEALNDLNDLPAFTGHEPKGEVTDHVKEMYTRFMADLPKAENQRFASPAVAEALDNALAGVAAGSLEPQAALAAVQAATDKALGR
jgi:raffinose/stachyose/melibiose transport system substrate-binding protein